VAAALPKPSIWYEFVSCSNFMKITQFTSLAQSLFLDAEEKKKLEKRAKTEPAIQKLIDIHDALLQPAILDAVDVLIQHLDYSKKQLAAAREYSEEDAVHKINEYNDEGGIESTTEMSRRVFILANKQSGLPERTRDLFKTVADTSIQIMEFISIANQKSGKKVDTLANDDKLSAADIVMMKRDGRVSKSSEEEE
jgi:hypothetical protein